MATLFTNGICVINVHMGHYTKDIKYYKLEVLLFSIKDHIMKKGDSKIVKRYIISGDFNYNNKEIGKKKTIIKLKLKLKIKIKIIFQRLFQIIQPLIYS